MFIDAEPDPLVPGSGEGPFWCVHTLTCLGPDGEVAEPDRCGAGRVCYEEV